MRNEGELRANIKINRQHQEEARRNAEADLGMLLRVVTDYWKAGDMVTCTATGTSKLGPFTGEYMGIEESPVHGAYWVIISHVKVSLEHYTFENKTFNERGLER